MATAHYCTFLEVFGHEVKLDLSLYGVTNCREHVIQCKKTIGVNFIQKYSYLAMLKPKIARPIFGHKFF